MNSYDAIYMLESASRLHADGYITDEAYERFKHKFSGKLLEEHERYKRPWWKIW